MKYVFLLILSTTALLTILSADTITLHNGETIEGQLLKVSNQALIIEVLYDVKRVVTISLDHEQVISVVDESQEILYKDGIQQEEDLEDYYQKIYLPTSTNITKKDTIVFKNGDQIVGNIISIRGSYITFKRSDKPSHLVYSSTVEKIDTINVEKVQSNLTFNDPYSSPPKSREFSYPHPAIEFGLSIIQNNLNQYHGIYEELAENIEGIDRGSLRDINNPLIALNLGFDLKFSQYISVSFIGNFMLNFGDNRDYHEDTESFRLFLGELRYTFPLKSISPWIGVGYAYQSITLINSYSGVDIKYKSQSNTVTFGAGIILGLQSQFGGIFSLRYLPFGDKDLRIESQSDIQTKTKIDLSNIMLSASLIVNL